MSGFTSYADARGFQPLEVPSEKILRNLAQYQNYQWRGLKESQDLQRALAKDWLTYKMEGDRQKILNIRDNQKFEARNSALVREGELKNLRTDLEAYKISNPGSKAAVGDKLSGLVELVPQLAGKLADWKNQQNKRELNQGLDLINRIRATPKQIADLRAVEGQLWDADRNHVAAAEALVRQGATEADLKNEGIS